MKIALPVAVKDVYDSLHLHLRRMKYELQELRRRGAKSYARQYGERTCARCQRPLGKFWNSGAVCRGCSHRICSRCRVGTVDWKCTVCHAYRCSREPNHLLHTKRTETFDSVVVKSQHSITVYVSHSLTGFYSVSNHNEISCLAPLNYSSFKELKQL